MHPSSSRQRRRRCDVVRYAGLATELSTTFIWRRRFVPWDTAAVMVGKLSLDSSTISPA